MHVDLNKHKKIEIETIKQQYFWRMLEVFEYSLPLNHLLQMLYFDFKICLWHILGGVLRVINTR